MNFRKLSFKQRIWFSFTILTTCSIALTGLVSYSLASYVVQKNAIELHQDNLVRSTQSIDEKIRFFLTSVLTIMIHESFQKAMNDVSNNDASRFYSHAGALDTVFTQARLNEPMITDIMVATPIGDFHPFTSARSNVSFYKTELYERVSQAQGPSVWIEAHEDELFEGNKRVVTYVIEVLSNSQVPDSYLVVNVREGSFYGMFEQQFRQFKGETFLLNEANMSVLGDRTPSYGSSEDQMVTSQSLKTVPAWKLVRVQSKKVLLQEVQWIKWTTLLLITVCVLLAFLLSNLLTSYLLKPLIMLRNVMKQVGHNNLSVRFKGYHDDEISQVGQRFNTMLDQIQQLFTEVREAEREKRNSEIKALSAQIDPHFLYNTLNVMYWKARRARIDDVKQMITSLSRLFRLGLNNGEEITTLSKELTHVTEYITLQSFCYDGKFRHEIVIDEEVDPEIPMLRVLLQPVVENAILHGFSDITQGGELEIHIKTTEEDRIQICIQDNGKGFDPEEQSSGYALHNISQRLRLYYGGEASLIIQSKPGSGTTVTYELPRSMGSE
ncbi:sensor histidine kinase [Paenibacillus sp. PL2-23]|uniref:sensor histidine kinase n=1 Tax=Paenibacillus sp. PL2-23 TaxID=2100729 RepID=UPI0030F612D6